jgi:hypothetical protein
MVVRPWSKEETPEADRKAYILHTFLREQSWGITSDFLQGHM